MRWPLAYTYTTLPTSLWARIDPVPVAAPALVQFNQPLAEALGLQPYLSDYPLAQLFSGNRCPEGAQPFAQAYAGHQFGYFNVLGDGRAVLLGEWLTPEKQRIDIQFKGSGRTPFSRRGDGRAALAPMLREFLISEAMHALGIPTTRALAVVTTGEQVYRERPLPGAILTRVAASHIRVGTFELAARIDKPTLQALADYSLQRHYPEVAETEHPYLSFLLAAIKRQAKLISQWLQVGFIHGVMNTDNMSIAGETIDYGPCAFMDTYHPETVFSSIDTHGRYAFANQPSMGAWNLTRFAETLLPLLAPDLKQAQTLAQDALEKFGSTLETHWLAGMAQKLGLTQPDKPLIYELLTLMTETQKDYTLTFRDLAQWLRGQPTSQNYDTEAWQHWLARWQVQQRFPPEQTASFMDTVNPAVIPRNHHVEQALQAAENGHITPFEQLLTAVRHPFNGTHPYTQPPAPHERIYQTFCGT